MGNEIQKTELPISAIDAMVQVAKDPNISVEKLTALLRFQEDVLKNEREIALYKSLAGLAQEMPVIHKNRIAASAPGKHSYVSIEDIDKPLRPLLKKYELTPSWTTETENGRDYYVCTITHALGGTRRARLPYASDKSGSKNDAMAIGSGSTYFMKYTEIMVLNIPIAGYDDNAQFAGAISAEQIGKIERLISECGVDREAFGKYLESQFGTNEIPLIPAAGFAEVESKLLQKKKQK